MYVFTDMCDMVRFAAVFASMVHVGQKDKAGRPYIEHVAIVADKLDDSTDKTVAFLHDTVEDTYVTLNTIEECFGRTVRDAVDAITRRDGESYQDYICRVAENDIATRVKLADLEHNMDLTRLPHQSQRDLDRVKSTKGRMST